MTHTQLHKYFEQHKTRFTHYHVANEDYMFIKSALCHMPEDFFQDRDQEEIADTEFNQMLTEHSEHLPKNLIITHGVDETCKGDRFILYTQKLCEICDRLKQQNHIESYTIIVNDNHQPWVRENLESLSNVVILYWFMMSYYFFYPDSFSWNKHSKKVLFLPGKIDKQHRLCPVLDMFERNLLERTIYSFLDCNISGKSDAEWYGELLNIAKIHNPEIGYNLPEFTKILGLLHKDIDGIIEKSKQRKDFCMLTVSEEIYNQTNIEIVSETWMNNSYHITEKTFRPILAGQPFVHIGSYFTRQLESLGFRTFDHYTGCAPSVSLLPPIVKIENDKHYITTANIITDEIRRTIDIAYKFSDICSDPIVNQSIQNDIDYNAQHLRNIASDNINILTQRHEGFLSVAESLFTMSGH